RYNDRTGAIPDNVWGRGIPFSGNFRGKRTSSRAWRPPTHPTHPSYML
ncbi:unnamed protein product, partial [Ectocarpus sp. 12 AP-2014]